MHAAIRAGGFFMVALFLSGPVCGQAVTVPPKAGDAKIQAVSALAFAPGGILLLADEGGRRIVAIHTGDTKPLPGAGVKIADINAHLGKHLGAAGKDIEIVSLAVNRESGRAYLLVRKNGTTGNLLVTIDPSGRVEEPDWTKARHVVVGLPKAGNGEVPRVAEMVWAGDRLVVSARSSETLASKFILIPAPLGSEAGATLFSAETFHIAHRKWETVAPMQGLFPYEHEGRRYVVGAFVCTPVAKYPIESIEAGSTVRGMSMIELGSGNRPRRMFAYEKDGRQWVLINTFRFRHDRLPFGPSPYWTCRFDRSLLDAEKMNEEGFRRPVGEPNHPAIHVVEAYHGVVHMDRYDETRALVVRSVGDEPLTMELLELP